MFFAISRPILLVENTSVNKIISYCSLTIRSTRGHFKTPIWTASGLFGSSVFVAKSRHIANMPTTLLLAHETKILAFVNKAGFETPSNNRYSNRFRCFERLFLIRKRRLGVFVESIRVRAGLPGHGAQAEWSVVAKSCWSLGC